MNKFQELGDEILALKQRLINLDKERAQITVELERLEQTTHNIQVNTTGISQNSSSKAKIQLFRGLFHGREDVFPKRWENSKTGKTGYSPACGNERGRGICEKPKVKYNNCTGH